MNDSWLARLRALPYLYAPGAAADVRSVIRLRPREQADLIAVVAIEGSAIATPEPPLRREGPPI